MEWRRSFERDMADDLHKVVVAFMDMKPFSRHILRWHVSFFFEEFVSHNIHILKRLSTLLSALRLLINIYDFLSIFVYKPRKLLFSLSSKIDDVCYHRIVVSAFVIS